MTLIRKERSPFAPADATKGEGTVLDTASRLFRDIDEAVLNERRCDAFDHIAPPRYIDGRYCAYFNITVGKFFARFERL